jgi:hypothetical protein
VCVIYANFCDNLKIIIVIINVMISGVIIGQEVFLLGNHQREEEDAEGLD